ncbi:hypothetical protein [Alteriqipengyuania lutimaris]|uniref:hypothetical protein n=1 Tax=Alteriqipengyuania lutimaris TaxID=1538146 RepID=UPI0015F1A107|nr:hypothetical protein [Alteriqipengyuania lutimaris]MBB3033331.1 high-affinity Fe2+/Pb2+ permease [Alteriqipengyuania lutimaris]
MAGLLYAALMTAWNIWEYDRSLGSYLLGFVLYAVFFGVFWGGFMWLIERRSDKRDSA